MNWLYELLSGTLDAFTPEDQQFLKTYWEIIAKQLLTYHQRMLEGDIEQTLFDALPTNKSWYVALETAYEWQTYTITSVPFPIPTGTKEYKAYGARIYTTQAVALPIDMGEDVVIVSATGNASARIDGTKVLGTGTAIVESYTSRIASPAVTNGVLTDSAVTELQCYRTPYDPVTYHGIGEVLVGGDLWDPDTDFTNIPIGTQFTLWAAPFETSEIVDRHTIRFTLPVPVPGRKIPYSHSAFQYVVPTICTSIPSFDNGWTNNVDYYINDGYLGFLTVPDDTLIAPRVYFYNSEIYEKFGKLLGLPIATGEDPEDYLTRLQAHWYAIFAGVTNKNLQMAIHMLMGLPYIDYACGDVVCDRIEMSIDAAKEQVSFAINKFGQVSYNGGDYFTSADKHIVWANGGVSKIIRYRSSTEVIVDGYIPAEGLMSGYAAVCSDFVIYYYDRYGIMTSCTLQYPCVPVFAPGDTAPAWSRLCTGVRVYDTRSWQTRLSDGTFGAQFTVPDVNAYITTGATDRTSMMLRGRQLRANVFVIELDDITPDLTFVASVIPSGSTYQVRNRTQSMTIRDDEAYIS